MYYVLVTLSVIYQSKISDYHLSIFRFLLWTALSRETFLEFSFFRYLQYQQKFSLGEVTYNVILFVAHVQLLRIVNFLAKCERFENC